METTTATRVPGSGGLSCPCEGHKDRCHFGRPHQWQTYYRNGLLVRTRDSYHCPICDAVCTADEKSP